MKKCVKFLAAILATVMVLSLLPSVSFAASTVDSGTCGDNLTWTLDSKGTLTISGAGAMTDYSNNSDVPWYNSRSSINAVVIKNGVTSIGNYAFDGCSSLTDVYYTGSESEWSKISIGNANSYLTSATIHYNYVPTVEIVASGSFDGVADWEIGNDNVLSIDFDEKVEGGTPVIMSFGDGEEPESITVVEGTSGEVNVKNTKTVKIFVWESLQSMKPICEAKTITIE